ncbi:MAG: MFS transporter [Chloroflexota bacterium]
MSPTNSPGTEGAVIRQRPRFFYGWVIVGVAFLCEAVAFGAGHASFAVFLQPMSDDLGWNRTVLSGAVAVQSLVNIMVTPLMGVMLDRYGPRVIMVMGACVAAVSYLLMGAVSEPWQFYVLFTLATALGLNELGNLVTSTTVAKWFVRRRGRALALSSIGLNVGAVVLTPSVAVLIGVAGWRSTWTILGFLVAGIVIPCAFLFRRTPEDMGLLPDGDTEPVGPRSPGMAAPSSEKSWQLAEALRQPTTWILVMAFNLVGLVASGLNQHTVAYLKDTGLSLVEAASVFAFSHVITIGAKVLWGTISDRIPVRYCLTASNLFRVVGLWSLLIIPGSWGLYGFVLGTGMGQGLGLLQPKIWADYYGRTFLGTIRGVLHPFSVIANVAGPLFAAYVYDLTQDYTLAFWAFSASACASAVLAFVARPPVHPSARIATRGHA